MSAVC